MPINRHDLNDIPEDAAVFLLKCVKPNRTAFSREFRIKTFGKFQFHHRKDWVFIGWFPVANVDMSL